MCMCVNGNNNDEFQCDNQNALQEELIVIVLSSNLSALSVVDSFIATVQYPLSIHCTIQTKTHSYIYNTKTQQMCPGVKSFFFKQSKIV